MRYLVTVLLAVLSAASCRAPNAGSPAVETPAVETPTVETPAVEAPVDQPAALTAHGWGPLRIGMTRAEVVAALGEDADPEAVGGPEPEHCDEFRPRDAPPGMRVMIEEGHLTRITVSRSPQVRTREGFGVGDPAAAVTAAYGARAETGPHKYVDPPAEYVTVWETPPGGAAPARGIVYEVGADGRVAHVHAGGPSIQYVEGCL